MFTQSLSVNSAQGTGQLPKIAIGNKKSAIFNFRLPKVNSQQFLLHQTPVEHCHCQIRKKTSFFKSQILDLFSPPTTLIPQTAIVGDEKFRLKSKWAVSVQLLLRQLFTFFLATTQFAAIYTPCVNNLKFIGKIRLAAKKTVLPITLGAKEVARVKNYGGLFPIKELIKMDGMLRVIIAFAREQNPKEYLHCSGAPV